MAKPTKWGKEFVISTPTKHYSSAPTITGLNDGRFIVAWSEWKKIVANEVRAQIFNADGSKTGSEFRINKTADNNQAYPAIATLANQGVVSAWYDKSKTGGDTSFSAVRAQIFTDNGKRLGGEFLVNTTTEKYQADPAVTGLANGRFVVAWSHNVAGEGIQEIRAQVFNAGGGKFGGEFLVNTTNEGVQQYPAITGLVDGRFAVAWTSWEASFNQSDVRGQIFGADGSKSGGEFLVNTTTLDQQDDPTIAGLTDGRFVIAWTDSNEATGGASASDVRAQIFSANGSKSGSEVLVNTMTQGRQSDPTITGLADGRFVVCWLSWKDYPDSTPKVRGQVFNADGSKSGQEFVVGKAEKLVPSATITNLPDGRFVVAWSDQSFKESGRHGNEVHGQIYDPREEAIDLKGTDRAEQFVGTRFDDIIDGADGKDWLLGAKGKDRLQGGKGKDVLDGGKGKDLLGGGGQHDKLKGGGGADQFLFAEMGKKNADTLVDFRPGKDLIVLDGAVFTGIGDTLAKDQFEIGKEANDAKARVIYDKESGRIFWDGDGKGGGEKVLFAKVDPDLKLGHDDFILVS